MKYNDNKGTRGIIKNKMFHVKHFIMICIVLGYMIDFIFVILKNCNIVSNLEILSCT